MQYKVLGFLVWHGARIYLRRSSLVTTKKGAAALAVAGGIGLAVLAQRQLSGDDDG